MHPVKTRGKSALILTGALLPEVLNGKKDVVLCHESWL